MVYGLAGGSKLCSSSSKNVDQEAGSGRATGISEILRTVETLLIPCLFDGCDFASCEMDTIPAMLQMRRASDRCVCRRVAKLGETEGDTTYHVAK